MASQPIYRQITSILNWPAERAEIQYNREYPKDKAEQAKIENEWRITCFVKRKVASGFCQALGVITLGIKSASYPLIGFGASLIQSAGSLFFEGPRKWAVANHFVKEGQRGPGEMAKSAAKILHPGLVTRWTWGGDDKIETQGSATKSTRAFFDSLYNRASSLKNETYLKAIGRGLLKRFTTVVGAAGLAGGRLVDLANAPRFAISSITSIGAEGGTDAKQRAMNGLAPLPFLLGLGGLCLWKGYNLCSWKIGLAVLATGLVATDASKTVSNVIYSVDGKAPPPKSLADSVTDGVKYGLKTLAWTATFGWAYSSTLKT